MKKSTAGILAALAAFGIAGTAQAQTGPTTPFSIEVRGGIALPIDEEGLETGLTFGADGMFQFNPMFAIYAGYNFNTFAIDEEEFEGEVGEDLSGLDVDAEIKGFRAGVRANLPFGTVGASPFVFGGVLYQSFGVNVSDDEAEIGIESDEELGFEVGGGVEIPLGNRLSFTPAASYNKVEDASWVKVDVGLKIRL